MYSINSGYEGKRTLHDSKHYHKKLAPQLSLWVGIKLLNITSRKYRRVSSEASLHEPLLLKWVNFIPSMDK